MNVKDLRLAMETAMEYADLIKKRENRLGRNLCTLVFQGYEPVDFKGLFQAWDGVSILREPGQGPGKKT